MLLYVGYITSLNTLSKTVAILSLNTFIIWLVFFILSDALVSFQCLTVNRFPMFGPEKKTGFWLFLGQVMQRVLFSGGSVRAGVSPVVLLKRWVSGACLKVPRYFAALILDQKPRCVTKEQEQGPVSMRVCEDVRGTRAAGERQIRETRLLHSLPSPGGREVLARNWALEAGTWGLNRLQGATGGSKGQLRYISWSR